MGRYEPYGISTRTFKIVISILASIALVTIVYWASIEVYSSIKSEEKTNV